MSGFAEITMTCLCHPTEEKFDVGYAEVFFLVCIEGWCSRVVIGVFSNPEKAHYLARGIQRRMDLVEEYIKTNADILEKITSDITTMYKLKRENKRLKNDMDLEDRLLRAFKAFRKYLEDKNNRVWEKLQLNINLEDMKAEKDKDDRQVKTTGDGLKL